MLRSLLTAVVLAAPCAAATSAVTAAVQSRNWPAPADRGDALLRQASLRLHNDARAVFGVAPLAWSDQLAAEAQGHANWMAQTGIYRHDMSAGRRAKMGENMWRGPRGVFAYEVMLGLMVDEGTLFRAGIFPNVSATGQWHDVGHYTQIVWPTTTRVGCALAASADTDYFVCRYSPKGNQDGVALAPGKQPYLLAQGGE